jgi:hypothetical protein
MIRATLLFQSMRLVSNREITPRWLRWRYFSQFYNPMTFSIGANCTSALDSFLRGKI